MAQNRFGANDNVSSNVAADLLTKRAFAADGSRHSQGDPRARGNPLDRGK
jgi:hypothetical protein